MLPNASKSSPRDMRDPPITIAALRDIGLFGALSDEILDHLAGTLKTARFAPGDPVFREGETGGREMFVILEGEIEVSKQSRRNRDMRVAILGPGDWFGEMSVIDMQSRSASVRALAPSRLIRITSEDLDRLYRSDLKSYTLIVLNIARNLSRRLRVTDGIVAEIAANLLDDYATAQSAQKG